MKEKLEGMAGGGAVSSENIDGGRKRSEVNLQVNEQSASADDLAGPPAKKNSLIENKKLMMEQQLGATGRLFQCCFQFYKEEATCILRWRDPGLQSQISVNSPFHG